VGVTGTAVAAGVVGRAAGTVVGGSAVARTLATGGATNPVRGANTQAASSARQPAVPSAAATASLGLRLRADEPGRPFALGRGRCRVIRGQLTPFG
jgi:hypothetical protein